MRLFHILGAILIIAFIIIFLFRKRIKLFVTRSYARGIWMPLLCAGGICLLTFGIIIFIDLITSSEVPAWRIVELMLDPGAFDASTEPAVAFQLLIALVGAVVFTSLLITTISNMFSNQAEAYRNGEIDVDLKGHILILGTNRTFYNSLDFLLAKKETKVILTSVPAKDARAKIASHVGSDKADEFIIVSGDRRYPKNLDRVSMGAAGFVYILGEDNEKDHDAANISNLNELSKRLQEQSKKIVECAIEIDDSDTFTFLTHTFKKQIDHLRLNIFNPHEILARDLILNGTLKLEYLNADDVRSQHLIVVGTSNTATEIAKAYLRLAHYPNFASHKIKSKLTIIDSHHKLNIGHHSNLKDVCHIHEYGKSSTTEGSCPSGIYGDFLDFEISHICGSIKDQHVLEVLEKYENSTDILSFVIADEDPEKNFKDGISLPHYIYSQNHPVYMYQSNGLAMDNSSFPAYYDNIHQFASSISLDHIYSIQYANLRRALVYNDVIFNRVSNIHAIDKELDLHLDRKLHDGNYTSEYQIVMTNLASYIQYTINNKCINAFNSDFYEEGYHLSWIMQYLLGSYHIMTKEERIRYKDLLSDSNIDYDRYRNTKDTIRYRRDHCHELFSLQSYEELDEASKAYCREEAKNAMIYLKTKALYGEKDREDECCEAAGQGQDCI